MATAKAVAAGNSCRQEDVIATANLSRKAVSDMLTACKVKALALFWLDGWFSVMIEWFGLVWRRRGVGMCQTEAAPYLELYNKMHAEGVCTSARGRDSVRQFCV